jgi:putative hydrolase of the HAD superfamily
MKIDAVAFDADDTLWHNEDHFAATEDAFVDMMTPWATDDEARQALFAMETQNLDLFGYGVKAFTLSMLEAAMELSAGSISSADLAVLMERGKSMLERPAELLPGVHDVLEKLHRTHQLILITKGDLHHQERKVQGSGVAHFFSAIEVVSEKDTRTYGRIARRYDIDHSNFVMVGNSVKSDILPIVELGGFGVHIPYQFTWAHEQVAAHAQPSNEPGARIWELATMKELPPLIETLQQR